MRVLYRYFLILIACASILLGIQIPNFIDQYEKRLDAHYKEVENNLRGYQEVADRHYRGSVAELIKKHEQSEEKASRDEAGPIRNIYERYLRFKHEKRSLETSLAGKIAFIMAKGDRELINETYVNYSFTIPLNRSAVLAGAVSAAFVLVVVELLMMTFSWLFRSPRRRSAIHPRVKW
jgi:hypothetical protein